MKKFKHIITCILAIVISVCLLSTSVLAAWQNDLGYWYVNSGYAQMVVGGLLNVIGTAAGSAAGSIVLPGGGTISGTFIGQSLANCATLGIYKLADYYAKGYTDDDFLGGEAAAIGGMDRTTAGTTISTSGFHSNYIGVSSPSYYGGPFNKCGYVYPDQMFSLLKSLDIQSKVMILGHSKVDTGNGTVQTISGFFFDADGYLNWGQFQNPLGIVHSSLYGMWNFSDLTLISSSKCRLYTGSSFTDRYVFYSKEYAEACPEYLTKTVYAFDWSLIPTPTLVGSSKIEYLRISFYVKNSSDSTWAAKNTTLYIETLKGSVNSISHADITFDDNITIFQPTGVDSASRPSSLMQAIHNYNIDNSYTDNSTTVNYFLAPKDQTPTSDNVVSPVIFNEETMTFTEPVTGAQYQSSGWTYDYTTRTYDISVEPGTVLIGDADITRAVCEYGNEYVTITYYDSDGTVFASDEYNYVMMAASECALNGHTYNANTTKEPTCTAAGERTYTCSACGDQYVEEIAKTDHVYADHSITKEPTCTVGGIESKTCSTCGDQITEKLDPLGHDFIAKEITETTFELPPGTSCPSCSGTNYTFSRSGVIYTLLCSDCNTEWTTEADVTYGSTTYVCSNCGESKVEGDATEETQETWFTKFIYKFKWLSSIGQIYRQLVADITSDAETAAAIADGTVTLDEVTTGHAELGGGSAGSEGSGRQYTAPELAVSFGDSDHYGVDWDAIKPLNLSWYAPHKETVDGIVSGILWLSFLFLLIKRAPSIIQGAEMVTEDGMKIDNWHSDSGSVYGLIRKYRTSRNSFYRR